MKIEYDRSADAIYVHLSSEKRTIKETKELEEGIMVDLDVKKQAIGIEILGVSKRFSPADLFEFSVKDVSMVKTPQVIR